MAKPTETRKAELKAWVYKFFNEVWDRSFTPPSDVQSGLIKYLVRDNISDEALSNIWATTKAWVKYYRYQAKNGEFVKLPCASVWYNDHRYDNPIPSVMEEKERQDIKTCCIEGCNCDVHGESFKYCSEHIPNAHSDEMAKAWAKTGIKYKSENFIAECRRHIDQKMSIITARTGE